jgi:hypothetical protein
VSDVLPTTFLALSLVSYVQWDSGLQRKYLHIPVWLGLYEQSIKVTKGQALEVWRGQ